MSMLLGVIAGFAVLSLIVAILEARRMIRLAPAQAGLGAFMVLGWWKFGQLEAKAGPAAAVPFGVYKRAAIAFLVFIVLGVMLSGWVVNQRPEPVGTATSGLINDPRVIPAETAFNTDLRRVAVPGAPLVES